MTTNHRVKKYRMRRVEAPKALARRQAQATRAHPGSAVPVEDPVIPTPADAPDLVAAAKAPAAFGDHDDGFGDLSMTDAPPRAPEPVEDPAQADAQPGGEKTKRMSAAEKLRALRRTIRADSHAANSGTPPKDDPSKAATQQARAQGKAQKSDKSQARAPRNKDEELEAIRQEGLSARQLRIARRIAQKQGLEAENDYDAIRLLRQQGTDPFRKANILDLVENIEVQEPSPQLPQTVPQPQVPSRHVRSESDVAEEVSRVQKEIMARRRKRSLLLMARLALFVFAPTALAAYYFFQIATPMYATHSEFVIQQADPTAMSAGIGGIQGGALSATTQDAIAVQSFLHSRDAMLRLDGDEGFRAHFSDPEIDPVQRLDPEATNEDAFKLYQRRVSIGFDPTEGIVKMEVVAADPDTSRRFSEALISYAEAKVDDLTQRLREDQMSGARESYEEAEAKVLAAQQRVLRLQEQRGVLSADLEVSALMNQITALETELNTERLRLAELMQNARPNQTRVEVAQGNVDRLEALIQEMRGEMTEGANGEASLARVSGELVIAQADLETRQILLGQTLQQLENARIEANRQVRYLSLNVTPVAPDEATYPRAIENTVLALMVFGGIYLMLSLTASILREQITG